MLLAGCSPAPGSRVIQVLANVRDTAPGAAWPREINILKEQIFPRIGAGDRIVVAPIGAHSYTDVPDIDLTLEVPSAFGANPLELTLHNRAAMHGALATVTRRLAADHSTRHTEIIAALMAAADRFAEAPNATKILILDSTGYEQSSLVNMADVRGRLDPQTVALLVANIRQARELPHLNGVSVCVAGISSGEGGWAEERRLLAIHAFWKSFFRATGANLVSYGPTLGGCLQ